MRKNLLLLPGMLGLCLVMFMGCRKERTHTETKDDLIRAARNYFENNVRDIGLRETVHPANPFTAASRQLTWDKADVKNVSGVEAVWVPVHYPVRPYIGNSLDRHRLFNANYLQHLRVWRDSSAVFHSELVTCFPDSNYVYGQGQFSGIVLVQDWQDIFLKEYKFEKNGRVKKMTPKGRQQRINNDPGGLLMIQACYYSEGYNYADGVNPVYWTIDLGCEVFVLEEGGHSTSYEDAGQYWGTGGGAGTAYSDPPTVPNVAITNGNNIIGDIKDYTKCFDNIAGYGQHYSVTVCVAQPVPGTRESWGFTRTMPAGSADLVSAGHAFLILTQWDMVGRITRNVGFYPKTPVSPFSPIVQGQLNNDDEHEYDISLTIEMDNSKFFTLLDFISHGNDPGYNYDLNSNNCSSFAIRALRSTGINLPFNPGTWPNGGGFNPGDLGEDIRSMALQTGMTKSTEKTSHPNWGICY